MADQQTVLPDDSSPWLPLGHGAPNARQLLNSFTRASELCSRSVHAAWACQQKLLDRNTQSLSQDLALLWGMRAPEDLIGVPARLMEHAIERANENFRELGDMMVEGSRAALLVGAECLGVEASKAIEKERPAARISE